MKRKIRVKVLLAVIMLLAGIGTTQDTVFAKTTAAAPKVDKEGNVKYTYVYYGSYPQREIVLKSNKTQIAALKARNISSNQYKTVSRKTWSKIVHAKYNANGDATVNGVKYRRMKMTDATQAQSDTWELYKWTDSETYHYFQYDPIKWRVLQIAKGKALLLSEYALDDEKFNDTGTEALMWNIKWKNSTIRSWLNGYSASANAFKENFSKDNFIDAAFTRSQQKKMIAKKLSGNIKDKVFLLDEKDVYNTNVAKKRGFLSSVYRQCWCTTYAYAKGIWRPQQGSDVSVMWWLSTDDAGDMAPHVTYYGEVDSDGRNNNKDALGVRPAIMISKHTLKTLKATN